MTKIKKPIEFVIAGGLGNQLFMLFAGLYFQENYNREVKFDVSDLERISLLHPGLNVCSLGMLDKKQISNRPAHRKKIKSLIYGGKYLEKIGRRLNRTYQRKVLKIQEVGFFDFKLMPPKTERVEGYFQSWRYFAALKIKPMLTIESLSQPTSWYVKESQILQEREFAAFHIRRGDYLLSANRSNGILSVSYFKSVADLVPKEIEILVFTDSPEGISVELEELGRQFRVITPPDESDPVESLLLMTLASHIVISNSTYSWWAAMFAAPGTTVYAPTKWFELRDDPAELLPDNWTRVKSDWKRQQ
jgi:hypothetical protein